MQTVPRLIKQFVPDNYKLSLNINRTDRTFNGIITIQGHTLSSDGHIKFHSKDLDIESIVINGRATEFSYGDNDELIITKPEINSSEQIIVIAYNGKITDLMHGMYPCYYDHDETKKELIATQFESHHAREVFPCIDEPEAKATFDLTLTTETNVTVLGNMPIKDQRVEDNNLVTTFQTTPVMSTYLLAWVIGELHKKTATSKNGVEVNVWASPAQPSAGLDFALDIATRSIDFYDNYFGTPYPLPKCDHVALPDFSSGAMENWGLITYREIALIADPATASISVKRYIATVIAHELSHQWFGNLVTMKWWDDLWLNESFASLVEYDAVDSLEPDWDVWLEFASYESVVALKRDSLAGVQPVQIDVNHPDEINTLFDGAIVYAKGAHLLQMLRYYIGDDVFQSGLREYFNKFAYGNTEASDLWFAFASASHKDIATFMNTWISQPGFPVLHVTKSGNQISLSQERLSSKFAPKSDALWPIPLNSNCPKMPEIFDACSLVVDINSSETVRFNIGGYAHYVTHYDHEMLSQLIEQQKSGVLLPIDRLQLLNEQTILASAGIISNSELVFLLDAFKKETTESVWDIISMTIGELKKFVETDEDAEYKLHLLAKNIAWVMYDKLGWDQKPSETENDTKLRNTILSLMLYSKDSTVINKALELYNSNPLDGLNPELRALILSSVVRHNSDGKMIDTLLEVYKTTCSSELKQDINIGLTATNNTETITLLLETIKDTSVVRTQDTARWVAYLIRNKYARNQTWQWLRDNWTWIEDNFRGDKSYDDFPRYAANALNTSEQLGQYRDFFGPMQSNPALERVIKMGINEIADRVALIEYDGVAVRNALLDL